MKFSSLIVLALAAQFSFAAPMLCRGTNGYAVSLSSNLKKARITRNHNPVMFGNLNCTTLYPHCIPNSTSENCKPLITCNTAEHVADAGYNALIRLERPGKQISGKLSEQSIMGPREVSKLKCVAAVN